MKKFLLAALASMALSLKAADVQLGWDPNPPSDQVTGYKFYLAPGATNAFALYTTTTNTTVTVTNLTPGVYRFQVTAINVWNKESPASNVIQTPPGQPTTPVLLFFRVVGP